MRWLYFLFYDFLYFLYHRDNILLVDWINPSEWFVLISLLALWLCWTAVSTGGSIRSLCIRSIAYNVYVFFVSGENGKKCRFIGIKSFTTSFVVGIDSVSLDCVFGIKISNMSSSVNTVFILISSNNNSRKCFIVVFPLQVTLNGLHAVVFRLNV